MNVQASTAFQHVCEVCGRIEQLTPTQAHASGWDYPPTLGVFGVISPRTCRSCPATATAWWQIIMLSTPSSEPDERHVRTTQRIHAETQMAPNGGRDVA